MKKLAAFLIVAVCSLWATSAFAQYSALGEDGESYGPTVGVTALGLFGDDAAGDSTSEFLVGIDLGGINDFIAWNVFWATGEEANAFGGSANYIVANNFEDCGGCGGNGAWWFGPGLSLISVSDAFAGDGETATGADFDALGLNLGVGYVMDDWSLDLRTHYFWDEEVFGVQASVNYNIQ